MARFCKKGDVKPWNIKVLPRGGGLVMKYKGFFKMERLTPSSIKVLLRNKGWAMKYKGSSKK